MSKFQKLETSFKEVAADYEKKIDDLIKEGLKELFSTYPHLISFTWTYFGDNIKANSISLELPKSESELRPYNSIMADIRKYSDRPNILKFLQEEVVESKKIHDEEENIRNEIVNFLKVCPSITWHKHQQRSRLKFTSNGMENTSSVTKVPPQKPYINMPETVIADEWATYVEELG